MPTTKTNPQSKFYELLQGQIHNEFNAAQQYTAIAVWFDNENLPRLAKLFYVQAVEERNHAMALVQFMMDTGHHVEIPSTGEVRNEFSSPRELVELALEQEKEFAADFNTLMKAAREDDDYTGEQLVGWFLKEQVEEINKMSTLIKIMDRANGNLFEVERFIDREDMIGGDDDPTMPDIAGGKL